MWASPPVPKPQPLGHLTGSPDYPTLKSHPFSLRFAALTSLDPATSPCQLLPNISNNCFLQAPDIPLTASFLTSFIHSFIQQIFLNPSQEPNIRSSKFRWHSFHGELGVLSPPLQSVIAGPVELSGRDTVPVWFWAQT